MRVPPLNRMFAASQWKALAHNAGQRFGPYKLQVVHTMMHPDNTRYSFATASLLLVLGRIVTSANSAKQADTKEKEVFRKVEAYRTKVREWSGFILSYVVLFGVQLGVHAFLKKFFGIKPTVLRARNHQLFWGQLRKDFTDILRGNTVVKRLPDMVLPGALLLTQIKMDKTLAHAVARGTAFKQWRGFVHGFNRVLDFPSKMPVLGRMWHPVFDYVGTNSIDHMTEADHLQMFLRFAPQVVSWAVAVPLSGYWLENLAVNKPQAFDPMFATFNRSMNNPLTEFHITHGVFSHNALQQAQRSNRPVYSAIPATQAIQSPAHFVPRTETTRLPYTNPFASAV